MLWKWIFCLSLLIVVTSEEVEESHGIYVSEIEKVANEILRRFSATHGHKLKEIGKALKEQPRAQEAIINDYVEDLLEELNLFITMQSLDPVEMPDIKEDFEWKIGFIKYYGKMHLTDGWLQGLGTMNRYGDVKVTYKYPNVQIRLPLGYKVLMFDYKYVAKFWGMGPRGNVDGKTTNCRFTIDLDINMITLMATLKRFNLHTIGSVTLKFSGNILTDWMTNIFVTVTIPFVKPILTLIVQSFVSGGLQSVLTFYNGFMCNLLGHCAL